MTAVEWQFEQLFNSFEKFNNGEYSFNEYLKRNLEIREQAKEMEKVLMIEFASYYTPLTKEGFTTWITDFEAQNKKTRIMKEKAKQLILEYGLNEALRLVNNILRDIVFSSPYKNKKEVLKLKGYWVEVRYQIETFKSE